MSHSEKSRVVFTLFSLAVSIIIITLCALSSLSGSLFSSYNKKIKWTTNDFLALSLILESCYDLLANIDIFEKAVHIWKTLHPFLRTKVAVDKQFEGQAFSKELYFVEVDEKKLLSNDNIEYLRVKATSSLGGPMTARADWEWLLERETSVDPLNAREGLI